MPTDALDERMPPSRHTDDEVQRVQRRTLVVVVVSQLLGGAGLAAGVSVGALLAREMLGSDGLTGIPIALFTLGSALASFLIGRVSQQRGRRLGLGAGFTTGGIGAIGVVAAAGIGNVALLFVSLFLYGAGTAANLQARYAGTDLARPAQRGKAVSVSLTATTLGAVAGPNLITPLGDLAASLGLPRLAGPFLLAAVAFLAAGIALLIFLRPDPYLLARDLAEAKAPTVPGTGESAPVARGAYLGAAVMIVTQITMVSIMSMTPVHMTGHHHGLTAVGVVISLHIAAMYLPSLVTGALVDRVGRIPMAAASGVTLLASGLLAALAPADSLGLLIVALVLLGLGWNFGLIAGTALVVDATVPENRPKVQGSIDVLIALSGAGSGALAGVVMATAGFSSLSIVGGILALILVPTLIALRRTPLTPAQNQPLPQE